MLVIDIDTINKVKERDDMKDLKNALNQMQEDILANGLPKLDYVICRKSPKNSVMEKGDEFKPL